MNNGAQFPSIAFSWNASYNTLSNTTVRGTYGYYTVSQRYTVGAIHSNNIGVFAQDAFDVVPGRLHVRGGVRYGHFAFATTPNLALGVVKETVDTHAFTYQAGTVVTVAPFRFEVR